MLSYIFLFSSLKKNNVINITLMHKTKHKYSFGFAVLFLRYRGCKRNPNHIEKSKRHQQHSIYNLSKYEAAFTTREPIS